MNVITIQALWSGNIKSSFIFPFFLMSSSLNIVSQNLDFFPNYYNQITEAESLLLNEKKEESLIKYLDIFESFDDPFFKDVIIAFQLSMKLNNEKIFTKLTKINSINFNEKKVLIDLVLAQKSPNKLFWYNELQKIVEPNKCLNSYNSFVDSIFLEDQNDREEAYRKINFYKRKKLISKWDKSNKERIELFILKTKIEGLPKEDDLGVDLFKYYHRKMFLIFYHYPYSIDEYDLFLKKWMFEGGLHPMHYAWISDFHFRHLDQKKKQNECFFKYGVFALNSPMNLVDYSEKDKLNININRQKIGVSSMEHQLRLKVYLNKNKYKSYCIF